MKKIKNYICFILIVINFLVWNNFSYLKSNFLEVYFLDIGQGDGILIKTPDDKYMIIDGGPNTDILSKVSEVMPFWNRKIDVIMLSHSDSDHVGGLPEIIRNYKVESIIYNEADAKNSFYKELTRLVEANKINKITEFEKEIRLGCCVYLNFLWPDKDFDHTNLPPNDQSISFELIYKDTNFFFGGDLSKEYENYIAAKDSFLDVDVLKVDHHGSKTSTDKLFVEKLSPDIAVIQLGRENKFGHPHTQTIDNINGNVRQILRTDLLGTIKLRSDGENVIQMR